MPLSVQQSNAQPSHWSWHLALVAAALGVAVAIGLDPDSGGSDLERAQLSILRGGLVVLAVGFVGLWLLRAALSSDWRVVVARWRDAPAQLPAAGMIPAVAAPPVSLALWAVLAAWSVAVAVGLSMSAQWLFDATWENGLLETATVVSYFVAMGFAIALVRGASGAGARGGASRWIFVALAAGCFLIAAEETDWGQTYLRYESPEVFEQANIQRDFSLHNLAPPSAVPGTRWANWLLRTLGWAGGGVLPLLIFASAPVRRLLFAVDFPVPPAWSMALLFAAACVPELEGLYTRNNVGSELREFSISVAVVVWLGTAWRTSRP